MSKPVQLHVMLSPEEMTELRSLAYSLGTIVSDAVRILVQAGTRAGTDGATVLIPESPRTRTLRQERPRVRHLLNQSTHALNAIAKPVHESGVDALDLTEALEGVSYGLAEVRRDVAKVRRQAAELTAMPIVFGE